MGNWWTVTIVEEPPSEIQSILYPKGSLFRWECEYCRIHKRKWYGSWTEFESVANNGGCDHQDLHKREHAMLKALGRI